MQDCNLENEFVNPFDTPDSNRTAPPCLVVIFGASGDLTGRKLIPAMYNLMIENLLPINCAIVGYARRDKTNESFREEMIPHIKAFSRNKPDETTLSLFTEKLYYYRGEFDDHEAFSNLKGYLEGLDKQHGTGGNRVFYLSVKATYFLPIIEMLYKHKLIYDPKDKKKFSRVIIEKPFGHDYMSAIELQSNILNYLAESQIYRIDHYLGKETVQNLLVFRFANPIFENMFNSRYIDNIQITAAECIGIEERGSFYEETGCIRDIFQNHLAQVISLMTMEAPASLASDSIRSEKIKVLECIKMGESLRGQYTKGFIDGEAVKGYRFEDGVSPTSNVETFAAIQFTIDNYRWSGTNFYVRAGKRLAKRATQVCITFRPPPNILFNKINRTPNQLTFYLQPNE